MWRTCAASVRDAVTMATVDLVVTDLDGTLWFGEYEQTHPDHGRDLARARARGIPVLVATGRRVTSTRDPLARLGLAPPAVMMNGALAIDLATGERFHFHQYTVEDATSILAAFRSADLEPCVYVDHPRVDVFIGERTVDPSRSPRRPRRHGASEPTSTRSCATTPVLMFGIMGHVR